MYHYSRHVALNIIFGPIPTSLKKPFPDSRPPSPAEHPLPKPSGTTRPAQSFRTR
ncbi:hypothetical protein BS50DRAFT_577696 [Corynespora cassiicola Philippines]|uniref:Uncharacterized protein n=1 Tax=Corynespora cassiicola Philippines TaxID=1448308 RepID=A0A2T2NBK1_CORCC|nr:hypothetical protein BS50DRAFT_577696 [Corynespora cassiicola Philippines]